MKLSFHLFLPLLMLLFHTIYPADCDPGFVEEFEVLIMDTDPYRPVSGAHVNATYQLDYSTQKEISLLSYFLMIFGLFLYPIVEVLTGFPWPDMVFFGAECPTTIFLIGLFINATPRTNKLLLAIVSINAVYTGFSFGFGGFPVDVFYGLAGLIGLYVLIKN